MIDPVRPCAADVERLQRRDAAGVVLAIARRAAEARRGRPCREVNEAALIELVTKLFRELEGSPGSQPAVVVRDCLQEVALRMVPAGGVFESVIRMASCLAPWHGSTTIHRLLAKARREESHQTARRDRLWWTRRFRVLLAQRWVVEQARALAMRDQCSGAATRSLTDLVVSASDFADRIETRLAKALVQGESIDPTESLIYADWLEERGDLETAELIRLACDPGDGLDRKTNRAVFTRLIQAGVHFLPESDPPSWWWIARLIDNDDESAGLDDPA